MKLILASSSPFRRALLERLSLPFESISPDIDESALPGETAADLALRLARCKAEAVAARAQGLIIASDQVAVLEGEQLHKPGTRENAIAQLQRSSGKSVQFHTSLSLLNTASGMHQCWVSPYRVTFRKLNGAEIERYVDHEQPLHSAGSFKVEGLGISLFEKLEGEDPDSLIGLPMLKLCEFLRKEGLQLP